MHRFLILLLLMPGIVSAQHWRIQLSGGGLTSAEILRKKVTYANFHAAAAEGNGPFEKMGGFSIMRSDSTLEYGLSIQMLPIHFRAPHDIDGVGVVHHAYLGKPAVPITAFVNYAHSRRRDYGYIGANAGVVFCPGRVTEDFDRINYMSDFTVYYNSGYGYTLGIQSGYRRRIGIIDLGFQIQVNYAHLSLAHGTRSEKVDFGVIYFPLLLCAGYRM